MPPPRRTWRSPDGNLWVIEVDLPGSSNAMVLFYEPGGKSGQMDRYAWYISNGPESRSVTSRLTKAKVLESLTDEDLARLYRRSMKVSRPDAIMGEAKLL